MPLRLMLLFAIVTPLLGILQVEAGDYAANVGTFGYPNGASWAFAAYAACALAAAWWVTGGALFANERAIAATPSEAGSTSARRVIAWASLVNGSLCLVTLFVFGGIEVLSGVVGKGEFRTGLGGFGAWAVLTLKWFAPSVFAFACVVYAFAGRPRSARAALVGLGALTFLVGLSSGFKTSGLLILLPGFIVLLWAAPMRKVLLAAALAIVAILFAFSLFDTLEDTAYQDVAQFLLARFTIFQGDVSWYVWDLWVEGAAMPDYARTLLVAMGDQLFTLLFDISRADSERWVLAHYGSLLTYTVGYPIEGIEAGHSVTGTPFSEGLIAAGAIGIVVFGLAAGALTGFVYRRIAAAIRRRRPVAAALWCNYSVWALFAWLNGGEIVQLFHIAVITGLVLCWLLLRGLSAFALGRPGRRVDPLVQVPA